MTWLRYPTDCRWGRARGTGLVMSTPQNLLTIRETAAELRVSLATIERMLRRGDLPRIKIRHATRILRRDIEAYIEVPREGAA